jgi:hypothetical protein
VASRVVFSSIELVSYMPVQDLKATVVTRNVAVRGESAEGIKEGQVTGHNPEV